MRALAFGLWIAWLSIAFHLTLLPPAQLAWELDFYEKHIETLKKGNPKFLEIPEVTQSISDAQETLADPSSRRLVIWIKWIALLLLVGLGMFAGYAVYLRRTYATSLVLLCSLLFLLRQSIFHSAGYELLLQGANPVAWLLKNGHYQMGVSIIWYDFVLGVFFVILTAFAFVHIVRRRLTVSKAA